MAEDKKTHATSEIISQLDKDDSISSDESDEEQQASKVVVSKEFQENVIKYVKMDDLIRRKQKEMNELKEQRKPCEKYILKYLDDIKENVIEITNGKLRKNKSETKASLNQDVIKKAIADKIKDPLIVEDILNSMELMRPLNTHVNLKRTNARKKGAGRKSKDKNISLKDQDQDQNEI
jgi:Family of unknown function (DUF5760)